MIYINFIQTGLYFVYTVVFCMFILYANIAYFESDKVSVKEFYYYYTTTTTRIVCLTIFRLKIVQIIGSVF